MNVYMDYRTHIDGRPRGDVADFFPTYPTPFTASLVREGLVHTRRLLNGTLHVDLPAPWTWQAGQFVMLPDFWAVAVRDLDIPAFAVAQLLALPGFSKEPPPRKRQGIFSLFKRSSGQRWDALRETVEDVDHQVGRWFRHVRRMSWVQAEILQVMEEVAPFVGKVLFGYTLATLALLHEAARASHIHEWVRDTQRSARRLPSVQPLLQRVNDGSSPDREWNWIGDQPFEVAVPRWAETASSQWDRLKGKRELATQESASSPHPWMILREQMRLQLARVITATRRWLQAAAQEAMEDGRLREPSDIYLLELEEVKQMMTGEWSEPRRVHTVVEERGRVYHALAGSPPPANGHHWLRSPSEAPHEGRIIAPGWHPGWFAHAFVAEELGTGVASPLSYGHLLAAALDKPITVVGEGERGGKR